MQWVFYLFWKTNVAFFNYASISILLLLFISIDSEFHNMRYVLMIELMALMFVLFWSMIADHWRLSVLHLINYFLSTGQVCIIKRISGWSWVAYLNKWWKYITINVFEYVFDRCIGRSDRLNYGLVNASLFVHLIYN